MATKNRGKQSKIIRAIVTSDVYSRSWMIQRNGTFDEAHRWYCKRQDVTYEKLELPESSARFYGRDDRADSLIWLGVNAGCGSLMHEVFHATFWLADKLSCSISFSSDEPWAYFVGWLASEINKKVFI